MKIEVYSACWNEEIMMPHFLRHYSQFADAIYLYDNESTDSTLDIVAKYPIARIGTYRTGGEFRDDILIHLKNNVWKDSKADYVIVADTDELLYHPNIVEYLKKNSQFDVFRPIAYHMVAGRIPSPEDNLIATSRMGAISGKHSKMLIFKPTTDIFYYPGAHKAVIKRAEVSYKNELKILHYRYLTLAHRLKRNKECDTRNETNRSLGWSKHWGYAKHRVKSEYWQTVEQCYDVLQPRML
jgi:glycosyltransferase involved in cell wall biosynthesis